MHNIISTPMAQLSTSTHRTRSRTALVALATGLALLGAATSRAQVAIAAPPSVVLEAPFKLELQAVDTGWLVTAQEAAAFKGQAGFDETAALRPRAVMPLIDISKPESQTEGKIKTPFPIVVAFRGMTDAEIDPASFRVFYGALKIDITNRITQHVKVTREGFSFDKAQIPAGRHRLTLQIQDTKQRVAERELRIEVE